MKENAELRKTVDQLRKENKETEGLRQENERLKRLLEENEIPWESTPGDDKQIRPHSAFPVKSENPEFGEARTTAAPESEEMPTHQNPETRTAIPVNDGK